MTRTPVLRTAYNKSMQPVILLVLLMFAQQPDFGASLQKFLAFYRENRELLALSDWSKVEQENYNLNFELYCGRQAFSELAGLNTMKGN